MRTIADGIVWCGIAAWAALVVWHSSIVIQCGWPSFLSGKLFMAIPAGALLLQVMFFGVMRVRKALWRRGLGILSALAAGALIYVEASMRFVGYK